MDQEVVFFQDEGGLLISDRRVTFGDVTHLPKDVSSARVVRSRPRQGYVLALTSVGGVLLLFGASAGGLVAGTGFVLVTAGMAMRLLSKEQYIVQMTVQGKEVAAVRARDLLYADEVCAALTRASKSAGGWRPPRPDEGDTWSSV